MADNNDPFASWPTLGTSAPVTVPNNTNNQTPVSADDPFARWPTLGGNIPTREQIEENRARGRASQAAAERFQNLPFDRRVLAQSRNAISGVPVVGRFVDTNNPDVQEYRTGYPTASRVGSGIANLLSYGGAGGAAPRLFDTARRAATTVGAIGAADEAARSRMAGETWLDTIGNAGIAGARDAALTVPGSILARAITPRTPADVVSRRWNAAIRANDDEILRNQRMMNNTLADEGHISEFTRQRLNRTFADQVLNSPNRLPQVNVDFGSITLPRVRHPYVTGGAIGAILPSILSGQPVMPGLGHIAAGMAATKVGIPLANYAVQGAENATNAAIRGAQAGINRALRNPDVNRRVNIYLNNTKLSPEVQALMRALMSPTLQDLPSVVRETQGLISDFTEAPVSPQQ